MLRTHHTIAFSLAIIASASPAHAGGDSSLWETLATSESVALAFEQVDPAPLMEPEELANLLSSSDSVALGSFSNLPVLTAGAADGAGGEDQWAFAVNLAAWTPGISGDIGVRRLTMNVNASFLDILDNTDSIIGVSGMFRVSKGKIGAYFGGTYNKLGVDAGRFDRLSVVSTIAILSFGLTYEIGRWPVESTASPDEPARDIVLLLNAGGRYTGLDVEIDFPVASTRSRSDEWVDPMIGAEISVPLGRHFSIVGSGGIGGFGVASDLAWTASILFSWDFHLGKLPSSLQVGYLAIGDDYSKGSGRDRFEWDTIMHGLLLNWSLKF